MWKGVLWPVTSTIFGKLANRGPTPASTDRRRFRRDREPGGHPGRLLGKTTELRTAGMPDKYLLPIAFRLLTSRSNNAATAAHAKWGDTRWQPQTSPFPVCRRRSIARNCVE